MFGINISLSDKFLLEIELCESSAGRIICTAYKIFIVPYNTMHKALERINKFIKRPDLTYLHLFVTSINIMLLYGITIGTGF